ncbi:MAG: PDZ domain-containing protein [Vicinamibacteria bacterium]
MLWLALAAVAPLDLAAQGVVVGARTSVAILRAEGRTRVVTVGDSAFGGVVRAIERGRVTVDFDGTPLVLALSSRAQAPPPQVVRPPAAAAAESGLVLERRELERRLGEETSRILAETTLVPVQAGGHVTGFTLSRIPDGTVLSDAGLRAGDVLTHVNDVPIDSLATLIGLWPRLQGESSVRAQVVRGGVPVTLSVQLR